MKYPYFIFDQINAALVSIETSVKSVLKLTKPKLLKCIQKKKKKRHNKFTNIA